jgi:hypothetical protein
MHVEPANQWRPVTSEYQEELAPRKRRSLRDRLRKRAPEQRDELPDEAKTPAGILGVTWFYLLNAAAYFVSGSVLLSSPLSDLAYKLMRHGHAIVPFPVRPLDDVPFVNALAESLFIMAAVSAAVAVLWMARSRAARWITLLYAAAWIVRNTLYLFAGRIGLHVPVLSPNARTWLLIDLLAETLIFAYLALTPRARTSA